MVPSQPIAAAEIRSAVSAAIHRHWGLFLFEGIVLTGGGSLLNGMCDVAERVLQCQTRFGLPLGIDGWPEALDDPEWTTAAGLAMYSAKLKVQAVRQRESSGWLGKILR